MIEISKLSSHTSGMLDPQSATSIESNDLQKQRKKINKFIQENYRVLIANVDQLDQAQIICLGENHNNEMHRKINAHVVDMLYNDKSILLIEKPSQKGNEESYLLSEDDNDEDNQAKYVKKPIKIQGWDIEEDENHKRDCEEFVRAGLIYEKPKVSHFLELDEINELNNDLENTLLSTCSKITKFFSSCCTWCCIDLFIKFCTPCIKNYYENKLYEGLQKVINDMPIRNQRMCTRAQYFLEIFEQVIIMGGNGHFDFIEEGQRVEGIDYEPSNKAIRQTMDFLTTKKFAILIPKNSG